MIEPRQYQRECVDAVHAAATRGLRRPLVAMATGLGKSLCAAYVVKERPGRAVVLAHRDELLRQLGRSILMADPTARVGYVKAEEDAVGADVVVASLQTLARPQRLQRLLDSQNNGHLFSDGSQRFATVISDESHHVTSGEDENTFGAVLRGLGAFEADGPLVVGWTATPERGDGKALGTTWEEIVYEMGILSGIRQGFLCDIRAVQVQLQADFNKLHQRAGDFRDEEAADMLMEADAPKHAAEAYVRHAAGRRALAFVPTIAVARAFEEAFRAAGVASEHVSGEMAPEQRGDVQARFHSGQTLVVPNAQLWTEGFDEPACDCIIMARPTRSRPFAIQMIGRGTRIYPGKADCLVLDLVGKLARMDLVTVASLFDVSPGAAEHGVAMAVAAKMRAGIGAGVATDDAPDGQLVSVDVELFKARDFGWIRGDGGSFVLNLGEKGNLLLQQVGEDEFNVVRSWRETPPGRRWPVSRVEPLAERLSLEFAQGFGEDYVRKAGAVLLNAKDAAWRRLPATEPQRLRLMKRGRWRDDMDRGTASDALTALYAR